jgi:hypothetical protein
MSDIWIKATRQSGRHSGRRRAQRQTIETTTPDIFVKKSGRPDLSSFFNQNVVLHHFRILWIETPIEESSSNDHEKKPRAGGDDDTAIVHATASDAVGPLAQLP